MGRKQEKYFERLRSAAEITFQVKRGLHAISEVQSMPKESSEIIIPSGFIKWSASAKDASNLRKKTKNVKPSKPRVQGIDRELNLF